MDALVGKPDPRLAKLRHLHEEARRLSKKYGSKMRVKACRFTLSLSLYGNSGRALPGWATGEDINIGLT